MQENGYISETTMRDYIRVLFRQKWVILLTMITIMATAFVGVMLKTPEYEAQVKMLITGQKQTQAEYYSDIGLSGLRSEQITLTQSEIVSSDPVLERAVLVLGLGKKPVDYEAQFASWIKKPVIKYFTGKFEKKIQPLAKEQREALMYRMAVEDLRGQLKVSPVRDTDIFLIKVRDFNPLTAAITANVVSRSYAMFDLEQQLAEMQLKYGDKHLAVIQLKEAIDKMGANLNGQRLPAMLAIGPATVKIIEQAKVPLKPSGISRTLMLVLAFIMSVFLSLMAAFTIENSDQTFRSAHDVESILGINYLAALMRHPREKNFAELSDRLYLACKDKGYRSLLLTSAISNEGVTPILTNLGKYLAGHLNKKVLLIDGNLRRPILYKAFKLNGVLNGAQDNGLAQRVMPVAANLDVLTLGTFVSEDQNPAAKFFNSLFRKPGLSAAGNPIATLESDGVKDFIEKAQAEYDFVLIGSGPLVEGREIAILASFVDAVAVVINERQTRRHVVKHAMEPLLSRKIPFLGAVLNGRTHAIPKVIYDRV